MTIALPDFTTPEALHRLHQFLRMHVRQYGGQWTVAIKGGQN
jgi:hypothetical protein